MTRSARELARDLGRQVGALRAAYGDAIAPYADAARARAAPTLDAARVGAGGHRRGAPGLRAAARRARGLGAARRGALDLRSRARGRTRRRGSGPISRARRSACASTAARWRRSRDGDVVLKVHRRALGGDERGAGRAARGALRRAPPARTPSPCSAGRLGGADRPRGRPRRRLKALRGRGSGGGGLARGRSDSLRRRARRAHPHPRRARRPRGAARGARSTRAARRAGPPRGGARPARQRRAARPTAPSPRSGSSCPACSLFPMRRRDGGIEVERAPDVAADKRYAGPAGGARRRRLGQRRRDDRRRPRQLPRAPWSSATAPTARAARRSTSTTTRTPASSA